MHNAVDTSLHQFLGDRVLIARTLHGFVGSANSVYLPLLALSLPFVFGRRVDGWQLSTTKYTPS